MPPEVLSAVVLHAFPYGDSSKVVRLLTPTHGVISAIAKGAHRPKSKFGGRLQPLSEGVATIYLKPHRDLHTMAEFDVAQMHTGLTAQVGRLAAAQAASEIIMRSASTEPRPEVYAVLRRGLRELENAAGEHAPEVGLTVLWAVITSLGFAPAVDVCAVDGAPVSNAGLAGAFSVREGGFLCITCAASRETTQLNATDRATLHAFLEGHAVPVATDKHLAAHRRLLSRFVRYHVAEGRELNAVAFWERYG